MRGGTVCSAGAATGTTLPDMSWLFTGVVLAASAVAFGYSAALLRRLARRR
ncbi:MAG: hypothetical protein M3Z25_10800 [Actinomycetota bacterium]|nr:hypothetical protein [Actinomycetota bacterium]